MDSETHWQHTRNLQDRGALERKARLLLDAAERQERDLTQSEFDEFNEIERDLRRLNATIAADEKQQAESDARLLQQCESKSPTFQRINPMSNDPANLTLIESSPVSTAAKSKVFKDPRDAYLAGLWLGVVADGPCAAKSRAELSRLGADVFLSQTEGVGSKGGYLVPAPLAAEIIKNRDEVGVAPRVARGFSMTSDTLRIPSETSTPTVYYPGEAGEITASDASLKQFQLTAKKRASLVRISNELLADAPSIAAELVVDGFGHALAEKMDLEFLLGNGTSTYGGEEGLIPSIGAAGVQDATTGEDTLAELDLQDWTDCIARLPGRYNENASWIMSRKTWNSSALPLMAAAAGNVFSTLQAGARMPMWLGYPVYFSDLMPTPAASTIVALFGDFRRAVFLGDRGDLRIATTEFESFAEDLVSFRCTHRYDILVAEPGDATDAGGYVALKLAS